MDKMTPGYFYSAEPSAEDLPRISMEGSGESWKVCLHYPNLGAYLKLGWIENLMVQMAGRDHVYSAVGYRIPLETFQGGIFSNRPTPNQVLNTQMLNKAIGDPIQGAAEPPDEKPGE